LNDLIESGKRILELISLSLAVSGFNVLAFAYNDDIMVSAGLFLVFIASLIYMLKDEIARLIMN